MVQERDEVDFPVTLGERACKRANIRIVNPRKGGDEDIDTLRLLYEAL
jgi:hypothetical protein